MRTKTRRQRYAEKKGLSIQIPFNFVAVNFDIDDNLAFLIRTAACYGAKNVYVIGSIPPRRFLNSRSGSMYDYVSLKSFKSPSQFMSFARGNNIKVISAELNKEAKSLYDYNFDLTCETALVLGHETYGVPTEISFRSENIYIPMPGVGYCLNTSQTGTAIINEYARQYSKHLGTF